ncbi:MAG: FkbM family methyltransferase [Gemmatimonas sp.]
MADANDPTAKVLELVSYLVYKHPDLADAIEAIAAGAHDLAADIARPHAIVDHCKPGDLVFDIGAHLGRKSKVFLHRDVRVVLVEPQPKCVEWLRLWFSAHPLVRIVPKGVGSAPGTLNLSVNSKAPTISTFADHWKTGRFKDWQWDEVVPVPVTTLDELIAQFGEPTYVKIDVEGFEREVLKGLTRKTGVISFEFTSEFLDDAAACVAHLGTLGYREFTFSEAEQPGFSAGWSDADTTIGKLRGLAASNSDLWGDIYAR